MDRSAARFEIKRLTQVDLAVFQSLVELFNTVFEEDEAGMASEKNLTRLLSDAGFIALAAVVGDEVVGGLTAFELPLYTADRSEIFVYDLAVKAEYQRRGVGKGLIDSLKELARGQEVEEIFVLAHEEDGHAIEFYHATGGRSERVVNFVYTSRET